MKLISYSLWGSNPKYFIGAIKNAESCDKFYPDWDCIFYLSKDVPEECKKELTSLGAKVIVIDEKPNFAFNANRFLAMDIEDVTHVIFRDTDSRFCQREVDAVEEWLNEDKTLHVMKDHPYHGNFPILAGMFGLNKKKFPLSMKQNLMIFKETTKGALENQYYFDQIFLQGVIWESFKDDCTMHDEFFNLKPFPSARQDKRFVGESFEEDDSRNKEHLSFIE